MLLADSSYPLLNVFWSMFIFFLWIIWIWILIMVFIDIFRSHDLGGFAKALWFLFVLFIPLLGVSSGPQIATGVSLCQLIGYNLLIVTAVLVLRVLFTIFRTR